MTNNLDILDKRHVFAECDDKYVCKVRRSEHNYRQVYEYDKKMKREIANSNERRRMQSINTGFETLKQLLPMSMDGEKLSKASILQLTAKYIQTLLTRLSNLEKEIACYKKPSTNKDKFQTHKSPSSISQEQTRKRRLNSLEVVQTTESDIDFDTSGIIGSSSLQGSETCLLGCENSEKTPGSLEHLVAAIEQVEGERFYVGSTSADKSQQMILGQEKLIDRSLTERKARQLTSDDDNVLLNKTHSNNHHSTVMKPTISPYTEKIILAVSQHPHMFDTALSGHLFANTTTRNNPTTAQSTVHAITSDANSIESSGAQFFIERNKTL